MNVPSPQTPEQVSQVARIISKLMAVRTLVNKENTEAGQPLPCATLATDASPEEEVSPEAAANATPQDARVSDKGSEMSPKQALADGTEEKRCQDPLKVTPKADEDFQVSKIEAAKVVLRLPLVVHENEPPLRSPTATPVGKRPSRRSEF